MYNNNNYYCDCKRKLNLLFLNTNKQVAQNGLEILCYLAERMREDFRPYISTGFPS